MSDIFVSYRRSDGGGYAGRIFDALCKAFGPRAVFRDVDTIQSGIRFPQEISTHLDQCRVFIPIIGQGWIHAAQADGKRRLEDPEDWVRIEIDTALKRGVCVIPVTVGGATMPAAADLPEPLRELALLQARDLRDGDTWNADLKLLLHRIARELGRTTLSRRRHILAGMAGVALIGIAAGSWTHPRNPFRQLQPDLAAEPVILFDTTNKRDVNQRLGGPTAPAEFAIEAPRYITHIHTYHWNHGNGSMPGRVSLRRADGKLFGPWEVRAFSGHNNAPNVNWVTEPKFVLPAGRYTVLDSEPETWSYNRESGNTGFAIVKGLALR